MSDFTCETSVKKQAVDGVNETIQTIRDAQNKHEDQECYVTLVSFNSSEIKTIYEKEPISQIREMSSSQYYPNCSTPLYDAMGFSITHLMNNLDKEDKVLVRSSLMDTKMIQRNITDKL